MTAQVWKELYIEIDENYNSFLERWRKHDFKFPEQYEQNSRFLKEILEITHEVIFTREELKNLLLDGMDYDQSFWMENIGMKIDTIYLRYIPILLYKIEEKIREKE